MDRKKYIVEASDDVKKVIALGVTHGGAIWTDTTDIENLEELNSDYINEHFSDLQDTAYQKGLHDGESKCRYCNEYQRGLDDAWEAARKLFSSMADSDIEKVFPTEWNNGGFNALINLQPQKVIEKLKAYEEKQKVADKIEVGDEVNWLGDCFIVTQIFQPHNMKEQCCGIDDDGCVYRDILMDDLEKTGRHFDIDKILEEMKE